MALHEIHDANVRAYELVKDMQEMKAKLAQLDPQSSQSQEVCHTSALGITVVDRRPCGFHMAESFETVESVARCEASHGLLGLSWSERPLVFSGNVRLSAHPPTPPSLHAYLAEHGDCRTAGASARGILREKTLLKATRLATAVLCPSNPYCNRRWPPLLSVPIRFLRGQTSLK